MYRKDDTRKARSVSKETAHSTLSPPTKSWDFRGFDSSKLLILKGGNSHLHESYMESPGKFDSRTLSRETLSRGTGRISPVAIGPSGSTSLPSIGKSGSNSLARSPPAS